MVTTSQNYQNLDRKWIRISLWVSVAVLLLKSVAFLMTNSAAILSDAIESIVHLIAVIVAFYSMRFSQLPADKTHPYGHAKIAFFSTGFEGLMIALAALIICWKAITAIIDQTVVNHLEEGMTLSLVILVINLMLGFALIRASRKTQSRILKANGLHILTDAWTSAGVWVALILVYFTGWPLWDPIAGILISINILFTASKLIIESFDGLMDKADPQTELKLRASLRSECEKWNISYHRLKFRDIGGTLDIDVDLLFPDEMPIKQAHEIATTIERSVTGSIAGKAIISTHLEPIRHHSTIHPSQSLPKGK